MGKALYRKYRSKSLDEIVGQKHVTAVLSRALKQGKIAHAYLLTGPRGVGKTSIARILAHEINQLPYTDESTHLDIIEIDAASNNGVDDVRDLRDKVQIAPVSAHKKIYIIDEVHMLSKPAFNALLKTLEEPPEHVVFILATTNAEKLPDTIISRTQRFGFRTIGRSDVVAHLTEIAQKENILIDPAALETIAERGEGSFRDSISLLDQLSSLTDEKTGITLELVEATLGLAPHALIDKLVKAVTEHDGQEIIKLTTQASDEGVQATVLIDQLTTAIKHTLAEQPQLVSLLDDLLGARDSSKPDLKLLTALLGHAVPRPKSAALAAPAPVISAPVETLKKTPVVHSAPPQEAKHSTQTPKAQTTAPETQPTKNAAPEEVVRVTDPEIADDFDWDKLVEYVRVNHVALHSVLSKCSYEIEGTTLKLYTMRKFNKTKLDDAKYRAILATSLRETGAGSPEIKTIPTPPPPKDSKAAAVAAIMGGGEEVSV